MPPCQFLAGIDASHYDGTLTRQILARAKAEGIAFFTHKIAEGLSDTEGAHDDTALAAARDAGIGLLGGYVVPRSSASHATVAAQVDRWLALADAGEPWWRTWPGWFWQVDLERWSYDNVPAAVGVAAALELRRRTGRWTILYASHGQYPDGLGDWIAAGGPLWNADYTGRPVGGFQAMYPGDSWQPLHGTGTAAWRGGWAPYGDPKKPKKPTILQYTSSATIAGLTTCDANAYCGSLDQLTSMITKGDAGMADLTWNHSPATTGKDAGTLVDDLWCEEHLGHSGHVATDRSYRSELLDEVRDGVRTLVDRPAATVELTAANEAALAGRVADQATAALADRIDALGNKVDALLVRLGAAGDALKG
jgi:hypothetical protein